MDTSFYKKLSGMIDDAVSSYETLRDLYKQKKELILKRDMKSLSDVDNKILDQVEIINKVNNIRDDFCLQNGIEIPVQITVLMDMVAKENPELLNDYKNQKVKIRKVADEIMLLNKTNVELIKHGLIVSDKILDIIVSAAVPQSVSYNKQGKNIESNGMGISSIVEDA
ncbi:flagellar export chaperone FlgN [bacterium]|nr:flagellar export chaperone FlgN [bacterium]